MPNRRRPDEAQPGAREGRRDVAGSTWLPSNKAIRYIVGAFVVGLVVVALPWSAVDYAKLTILENVGIEIRGNKLRHRAIAKMIENDPQLLEEVLGRLETIEEPADKIARPVVRRWPKDTARSLTEDGGKAAITGLGEVRFFSADDATMVEQFKADIEAAVSEMSLIERNRYLNGLERQADALGSFIRLWRADDSPFRSHGEVRRITAPRAGTAPADCTLHMYQDDWAKFGDYVRIENVEGDETLYLRVAKSMGPEKVKPDGTDIHVSPRDLQRLGLSASSDQAYVQRVSRSEFEGHATACTRGARVASVPL